MVTATHTKIIALYIIAKAIVVGCLSLAFVSCSSSSSPWYLEKSITSNASYNSSRLVFPVQDDARGVELEIVCGSYGSRMYLNVFSLPLQEYSELILTIEGVEERFLIECLQGGQRLLLHQDIAERIIDAFLADQSVAVVLGRYQSVFTPEGFSELYQTSS